MIQFDQINSHLKYNLLTKTTFKIMFICKISLKHTAHTMLDSSYESFECDPKLLD